MQHGSKLAYILVFVLIVQSSHRLTVYNSWEVRDSNNEFHKNYTLLVFSEHFPCALLKHISTQLVFNFLII